MMVMIVIVDYSKFHWVFIAPSYGFLTPIVVTTLSTFSLLATIESTGSPAILSSNLVALAFSCDIRISKNVFVGESGVLVC